MVCTPKQMVSDGTIYKWMIVGTPVLGNLQMMIWGQPIDSDTPMVKGHDISLVELERVLVKTHTLLLAIDRRHKF